MPLAMSVPRSMQRIVTVPSASGMLIKIKSRKGLISGMLLLSVYAMDFFRLSNMRRPAGTKAVDSFKRAGESRDVRQGGGGPVSVHSS